MDQQLKDKMNLILADLQVFYMKLHHFHWFVKGPHFFTLHEKFEELYEEVTGHSDDVAERLLQKGETPISTLKESLELASIKEATSKGTDREMVTEIVQDLESINKNLLETIEIASDSGDEVTVDLLLGISSSFEKHIWMYKVFLG